MKKSQAIAWIGRETSPLPDSPRQSGNFKVGAFIVGVILVYWVASIKRVN
jgi:hypothetical protein